MQVRIDLKSITAIEKYEDHKSDVKMKGMGFRPVLLPFAEIASNKDCFYSLKTKKGKNKLKTYIVDIDDIDLFKKLVNKKK